MVIYVVFGVGLRLLHLVFFFLDQLIEIGEGIHLSDFKVEFFIVEILVHFNEVPADLGIHYRCLHVSCYAEFSGLKNESFRLVLGQTDDEFGLPVGQV